SESDRDAFDHGGRGGRGGTILLVSPLDEARGALSNVEGQDSTSASSASSAVNRRCDAGIIGFVSPVPMKVFMVSIYHAFLGLFIASALARPAVAAQSATSIAGSVAVPAPDGQAFVVPGVTLTLTCAAGEPRTE